MPTAPGRLDTHLVRLSPATDLPRLLCLPCAGGRGEAYRRWAPEATGLLELWTTDLPGRYGRGREQRLTDPDEVAAGIASEAGALTDRPLGIFGHSMGALLAFEVALELESQGRPAKAVVVAGSPAPHVRAAQAATGTKSDEELVALMHAWGGTPAALLQDDEFLALALPPLRADLRLCDRYRHTPRLLAAPLAALAGSDDAVAGIAAVEQWKACAGDWRGLHILPGGHFFIHSAPREVLDVVVSLMGTARAGPARAVHVEEFQPCT